MGFDEQEEMDEEYGKILIILHNLQGCKDLGWAAAGRPYFNPQFFDRYSEYKIVKYEWCQNAYRITERYILSTSDNYRWIKEK